MSRVARRTAVFTAAVVLAAIVTAGIAYRANARTVAGAGASTATSGNVLVVDNFFTLKTADPARMFEPWTGEMVVRALYSTLLTFKGGDVSKPVPSLAHSYKVSKDGKTLTAFLRHGVKFANGDPLTSADVVFSFRRLINVKGNAAFLLDGVTVTAAGRYTVVLRSKSPNPALPYILPSPQLGILDAKVVRAHGGTDAANAATADKAQSFLDHNSAGSGPYVTKSYSTTSEVDLVANPRYWGPKPKFSTVVVRNVPGASQLTNVQRGRNEISLDLSANQAKTLAGNAKVKVFATASPVVFYMVATGDSKVSTVASNPHVWNAIRSALNYPKFVAIAGKGSIQAPGVVPSTFLGALKQSDAPKYDLAKAKSELAASGVKDPSITLSFASDMVENGVAMPSLAQAAQADLEAAGFKVTLDGGPLSIKIDAYRGAREALGIWPWGPDYPDPNDYLAFLPGALIGTRAGWPASANPALVALGRKAGSTTNPAARAALFQQLQRQLNTSSPIFPIIQPPQTLVWTKNLTGISFNPIWALDFAAIGSK